MNNISSFWNRCARIILTIMLVLTLGNLNLLPISASTKLSINLSNNQTFYILPGTTSITYDVKILSGATLGNITCSSSNLDVATIDNMGKLTLKDAGSTKITVTSGQKSVSRTIHVLVRDDWTKVVSIKNSNKLSAKNQICTLTMTNHMNFPVKMNYFYNTYTDSGSILQANITGPTVYLPAYGSLNYHLMLPEDTAYLSIVRATYEYSQYTLAKINTKKISIKQSIESDSNNKSIKYKTAMIKNNNTSTVIVPYHVYLYDQKKQLISVEYKYITLAGKQKLFLHEVFQTKNPHADYFTAKVTYKFETPLPFF